VFAADKAQAVTYTVTNTNDSGAGSLRQAMLNAQNDNDVSLIVFNIPGSGVRTITLLSGLPGIVDSFTIDGTTQPGYAGVPLIEINASNTTRGFYIDTCFGFTFYSVTIKGLIINRSSGDGIYINCAYTTTITGNYIGTDSSGTADLGNGGSGIFVATGASVIIGGAGSQRNLISGNNENGIHVASYYTSPMGGTLEDGNVQIYNNYIGTNAAGTADLGNSGHGIFVETGSAQIGGTSGNPFFFNLGNVISGNGGNGIYLHGSSPSTMQRNLIGTNAAGTAVLGNTANGIYIHREEAITSEHLIGSSTSASNGNTISGNGGGAANDGDGIKIENSSGVRIYGNEIGTNAAGTADLGNLRNGIEAINAVSTKIGLENAATKNTISGNNLNGILLNGAGVKEATIQNNYIGTNATGANLGNSRDGINVSNVSSATSGLHLIGGSASGAENTIAFNKNGHGINIASASTGNTIRYNTIHSNVGSGVNIASASNGNWIRHNSIYSNQSLGINLGGAGVTPNDTNDADAGANNLQNFPVLQRATPTRIIGTLNSAANQNFVIDFYRVDSCDASNHGQGRHFLTSFGATTAGNNADFNIAYSGLTVGQFVTATATDTGGNTSEFSQCLAVTADSGDFQFSSASYNATENSGVAVITVNRVGGSTGTISVNYATSNGTAAAGQDYTAANGTLTFANGETTKTFSVPIIDETKYEPEETFNVALSNPTGGALLLSPSSAVVTIADNDNPPTVSINDVSIEESNSGTTNFIFTVSLSEASSFNVSVNYATASGTATSNLDFSEAAGTLNFAAGEASKQVSVQVYGELTVELDETFFVNLSNPTNATIADGQGVGTILDDDNPGQLQFSAGIYTTNEDTSAVITVTRINGDAGTVTVDYATTTGGTASAGGDFTPVSGTLTFLDGETSKTFSVTIPDDQITEQTETVNLALSSPTGGATLGLSSALINITDNDGQEPVAIRGTVMYVITPANQSPKPVPGVIVSAGATSANSDASGDYLLDNLASGGNYTVSPSKTGNINGISPFDATLILRCIAAGTTNCTLTDNQKIAADTNGDNSLSPFDATIILRFIAAGVQTANTGQVGNWRFNPVSRSYTPLSGSQTNQNYDAILIGDVNGSWAP
jgi:parallel beta-helix repeat protein